MRNNLERTLDNFTFQIVRDRVELVELKDININFLLSLNKDFDDDLLSDAITMLSREVQWSIYLSDQFPFNRILSETEIEFWASFIRIWFKFE